MKVKIFEDSRYIVYSPRFFSTEFHVYSKKTKEQVTTIWAQRKGMLDLYLWDDKNPDNDFTSEHSVVFGIKIICSFMKY